MTLTEKAAQNPDLSLPIKNYKLQSKGEVTYEEWNDDPDENGHYGWSWITVSTDYGRYCLARPVSQDFHHKAKVGDIVQITAIIRSYSDGAYFGEWISVQVISEEYQLSEKQKIIVEAVIDHLKNDIEWLKLLKGE